MSTKPERKASVQNPLVHNTLIHETTVFNSPLPPPSAFREYGEINPDLPDIIIQEWKKEGDARRKQSNSFQHREAAKIAIVGTFAVGMLILAGYMVYKDAYASAVAIAISPLIAKILANLAIK